MCHDLSVYLISGQNSHLFSRNVFLQSIIYPTKKAWGKSRVLSTDPLFLHRRGNNDCRPSHGTWTLFMNNHLINKAVGRTQKTSFPLSSNSKASLCSDFKTNPSSWASKARQSTSVILKAKALGIYSSRAVRNIANDLLKTLLDSLHRTLASTNWPWLREAGNSNENNVCKTDSPYF